MERIVWGSLWRRLFPDLLAWDLGTTLESLDRVGLPPRHRPRHRRAARSRPGIAGLAFQEHGPCRHSKRPARLPRVAAPEINLPVPRPGYVRPQPISVVLLKERFLDALPRFADIPRAREVPTAVICLLLAPRHQTLKRPARARTGLGLEIDMILARPPRFRLRPLAIQPCAGRRFRAAIDRCRA
jgi:hypothetical protein